MLMIPVDSSAIRAIGFDGDTLRVQFRSSFTIYEHPGVPEILYERFLLAKSKGTFYVNHIQGRYLLSANARKARRLNEEITY